MSDTGQVIAPETTSAPSVGLKDLSSTQREAWLKTGDLPASEPAVEAPAVPDLNTQAVDGSSTDTPQVSEPEKVAKPPKPRDDTNARFGQLTEQKRLAIERAEAAEKKAAELEARLAGVAPPAPDATSTKQSPSETRIEAVKRYQREAEWPGSQVPFIEAGFADPYEAMLAAQAAYIGERQWAERDQAQTQKAAREKSQTIVDQTWAGLKEKYPDTDPKALGDVQGPSANVLAQLIFESPSSVDLLNYFSNNAAEARAVAAMEPVAAAHAIGKVESRLSTPAPSRIAAPTKTVSDAPEPPQTLGSRHTPNAGDELEQAVRDKDTGRYIELANRRELAEMKAGRR